MAEPSTGRRTAGADLSEAFFGANRLGSTVSQGTRDAFWLQSMQAGSKAAYDCIKQFSDSPRT
ncbi:hypothetical protein [Streptomyces sp. NPDC000880]